MAAGAPLARRLSAPDDVRLTAAWLLGAALLAPAFTALALLGALHPAFQAVVALAALAAGAPAWRVLTKGLAAWGRWLRAYLGGRHAWWLGAAALLLLVWLIALAWCPPRSADAMRYHLAQMADLAAQGGLEFRPYYHYNFPLYFSMLNFPVFTAASGLGMQMMVLVSFVTAALAGLRLAARLELKRPWLWFFWLALTPLCFHEAHVAANDWPLLAFALVGLALLTEPALPARTACALGFVGLGLALGTKYQAVLLVPWLVILGWQRGGLRGVLLGLGLMAVIACPFYLRNWINIGNPVWPLMSGLFPSPDLLMNTIAGGYSNTFAGDMSLTSLLTGFWLLASFPLIPLSLWLLGLWGLCKARPRALRLGWALGLFFGLWVLVQPQIYPRFAIFILPAALLAAMCLLPALQGRRVRGAAMAAIGLTLAYGAGVGVWYSAGLLGSAFSSDAQAYHRYTWFYDQYQWIDQKLPPDARLLVMVPSGHTYYLKRPYLRADPDLSALVDWAGIKDLAALKQRLSELGVNYVLYDRRNWKQAPGGKNMMRLMSELYRAPWAKRVWTRPVRLYQSRIRREYHDTNLRLMLVEP